ncbi:NADH:ubiquinone oxidoreductase [Wolbachia endosymbiont of Drosophila simulans wNo]|uniref:NADH-ubiquinone oxidoreductase subunit NDUFA12 family protein n=1 Tax=Wolbachia endosymbiont of Drosophila simulans TaxID=77038 RepID=UPI0002D24BC0|nr:NADH-ubiquinone oxidoreductase subunit NDUFA12 family protein [Wolbachia endosymbiont of Drosophila simulans]AGJ98925.1 NADH:ubiquinone oxidoreductase [Wolbachia endosymbiont of Drosophila simulans wNo]
MLSKIYNVVTNLLRRKGKLIGRDENGNSYYESNKGKRWVIYGNVSDPTTIPPECYIWLHNTNNEIPINNNKRKTPNLTVTKDAYYPKQKVKNYYESWNPNN